MEDEEREEEGREERRGGEGRGRGESPVLMRPESGGGCGLWCACRDGRRDGRRERKRELMVLRTMPSAQRPQPQRSIIKVVLTNQSLPSKASFILV